MKTNWFKVFKREDGVALVEFAVIMPMLIMLLLGLVELGRLTYYCILVGNSARAGAAYGAQSDSYANDTTGMQNTAVADAQGLSAISASATQVCSCWSGTTSSSISCTTDVNTACATGNRVVYASVTVTGVFHPLFSYSSLGLPATWTITRTAQLRVSE